MRKFMRGTMLLMVAGAVLLSGCDDTTPKEEPTSNNSEQTETADPQVLVDNENMKVTFVEMFEEPSIAGACYVRLKVENKTDKTVTVMTKDAYVNGTSVVLGSGVPMELLPDKSSQTPFFFFYGNLGITSKDEIESMEFKLWLVDEEFQTIEETESLVIDIAK